MHVVGRQHADAQPLGQRRQLGVDLALLGEPVVLQLDEEPVRPEDLQVLLRDLLRRRDVVPAQRRRNLAAQARARADQPRGELAQHLLVDPRLVVEPLEVADRGQLDQVPVTRQVLGEQQKVVARFAQPTGLAVPPVPGGHVHLAADNRLDAGGLGGGVELNCPEQVAVVGDRHGGHVHPLAGLDEVLHPTRAVEQRVLGVHVQMYEIGWRQRRLRHDLSPSILERTGPG